MKSYLLGIFFLFSFKVMSQTTDQNNVLKISTDIFKWEVDNKIDLLADVLQDQFVVVSSDGSTSDKSAYIKRLSGADFKHNAINITESKAVISGNTATVIGKGTFDITSSGKRNIIELSYIEVFNRDNENTPWKMLALKASLIN